jgi:phosphomannomutase
MVLDDVAAKHGVVVYRTRIGEANVVTGMLAHNCAYGGEGNGGVIFPAVSTVRDGLTGIALILESMALSGRKLTALAGAWNSYPIVKEKIALDGLNPDRLIEALAKQFAADTLDRQDGLKITRKDGWVHLRPSNTEPIMRCFAEARTAAQARKLADEVMNVVASHRASGGNR